MRRSNVVQLASPRADRPGLASTLFAMLACFALGAASARLLFAAVTDAPTLAAGSIAQTAMDANASPRADEPNGLPDAGAAEDPSDAAAPPAVTPAPEPVTHTPPSPPAAEPDLLRAPSIAALPPEELARPKQPLPTVAPGVVAYLRCDGLESKRRPYPCPRDRALEARVLRVLAELPRCAEAASARGGAEIRLIYRSGARAELEVRAPPSGPALDPGVVEKCAASHLEGLPTILASPHLVVAFRFALR